VISEGHYVVGVEEKPDLEFEILAGIYAMSPSIFRFIPNDRYYGMDDLIKEMLAAGEKIARYRIEDYWIDIGQIDDYSSAVEVYQKHFSTEAEEST